MEPKVSIILPSLNVADYIVECVESVLAQTLRETEIICVDAGSSDGTYEILEKYAERNQRIKVLCSLEKSYGKQVNMGLKTAKGKYIAIVETDDFIEREMYECLYNLAEASETDYAKADYDSFVTLKSGKRIYTGHNLFRRKEELYGTVLKPCDEPGIFKHDTAIWKGIYNRSFLLKNKIFFNETPGAAFQDIGFMLQVLCRAQRVIYTKKSFYRYRMDRGESSSNNSNVLKYVYQEFRRLCETDFWKEKIRDQCIQGIYRRMCGAFLCETGKVLKSGGYSDAVINSEEIKVYYNWFREKIEEETAKGNVKRMHYSEEEWIRLRLLLHSLSGYRDYLYVKNLIYDEAKREQTEGLAQKTIIIFGGGLWGRRAYERLDREGFEVAAVCDNDERIWNTQMGDVIIKSPECIKNYHEAVVVIACKGFTDEIRRQLSGFGVKEENIRVFSPMPF